MPTETYRLGAQAILIDNENKFLLVQLNGYTHEDWNFVGGGREGSETVVENLVRELYEELSLTETDYDILAESFDLKYDFPSPIIKQDGTKVVGQVKTQFVVRVKDKSKIVFQENEIRQIKWVSFSSLKSHLRFPGQYENALKVIESCIPEIIPN